MKARCLARRTVALATALAIMTIAVVSLAQSQETYPPLRSEKVKSMGQPVYWKPYIEPALLWGGQDNSNAGFQLVGGVSYDWLGKAIGGFSVSAEGYYRYVDSTNDGGGRLIGWIPFIGLGMGYDYQIDAEQGDFILSYQLPWRRGGPLGWGDGIRIDWLPTRGNSLAIGLSIPIFQKWVGKTRPQRDSVELPRRVHLYDPVFEPSAELQKALDIVRDTSDDLGRYTIPFLDDEAGKDEEHMNAFVEKINDAKAFINSKDEQFPDGHTFEAVINVYHDALERAFIIAAGTGEERGKLVAEGARRILRDEVVFPYNRFLGQRKRHDSLFGPGSRAEKVFSQWLSTSSGVPPARFPAIVYVFEQLIKVWDDNRERMRKDFDDSRLVWIPLHSVIKPEEVDSQADFNAVIEAAVDQKFTNANEVYYVINELFQEELYRMIHASRDYHVLWIHDYRGRNGEGKPDQIGYEQTVDAYLAALVDRVREYEQTRKIPVYMLFLDQIYYESNDGRLWLSLLEDPLGHKVKLPKGYEAWEDHIREVQDELRAAVAASPTLQAGMEAYGDDWLKNLIKVHVNNTNIADMSYRSNHLFGWLPNIPDVLLRDHRKISFYDVTELDPSKGEAIFTGMGVGEHYAGPTWDDRAILVRGPSLVHLKEEARKLVLSQGFDADEVPMPLRPLPFPDNYNERLEKLRARGWTATTMQVYNATGYGMKWSNMLKASLYNLMPKGTRMIIPDSLWNSMLWAGMMTGAALRGCWVLPISPSLANAPSSGMPQMSRANEVFTSFLLVQNNLQEEIEQAGGMFRVGIYDATHDVGDVLGDLQNFTENAATSKTYRKLFPFDQSVYDLVIAFGDSLAASGYKPAYFSEDVEPRKPKLHLKAQLFLSPDVVESLVPLAEWKPVIDRYMRVRAEQIRVRDTRVDAKSYSKEMSDVVQPLFESWHRNTTPEQKEKSFLFLTVGSHNMDYRGKFMDGEVLVLVAGEDALIAYMDFASIVARTTWINTIEQLDKLVPRQEGFSHGFSRFIRNAL